MPGIQINDELSAKLRSLRRRVLQGQFSPTRRTNYMAYLRSIEKNQHLRRSYAMNGIYDKRLRGYFSPKKLSPAGGHVRRVRRGGHAGQRRRQRS